MRFGGQYVAKACPMIHLRGTGAQNRLSAEEPRFSPIMKYSPGGIVTVFGKSQPSPPPQGSANGSFWSFPLRITWPFLMLSLSPGTATTRLMKLTDERFEVGLSHT